MAKQKIRETDLYAPVKAYLEAQGYCVKGEVGAADVVAVRGCEPPVIVEMKTGFSLALFHQAIDRLSLSDAVYVAVPRMAGRAAWKAIVSNRKLARRLGIGLMTVRLADGLVEVHCDPGPYAPRKSRPKTARLLKEFSHRVGDPNEGGMARATVMTAYRQDAMRCLAHLAVQGPTKAAQVAKETGVERARTIMAADHYGWFERVERGIFALTPKGIQARAEHKDHIALLAREQDKNDDN